eukprot:TRINITY_DN1969_c0_g1_i1.p1 TRINITY_DN1969_c0_g1~~TRINITY_DN1969_c0_g1_i1.p1  ORF type:complete len:789 (+),score=132.49 TRINITY_DN1969_c0_g1_i1:350-2368(+)
MTQYPLKFLTQPPILALCDASETTLELAASSPKMVNLPVADPLTFIAPILVSFPFEVLDTRTLMTIPNNTQLDVKLVTTSCGRSVALWAVEQSGFLLINALVVDTTIPGQLNVISNAIVVVGAKQQITIDAALTLNAQVLPVSEEWIGVMWMSTQGLMVSLLDVASGQTLTVEPLLVTSDVNVTSADFVIRMQAPYTFAVVYVTSIVAHQIFRHSYRLSSNGVVVSDGLVSVSMAAYNFSEIAYANEVFAVVVEDGRCRTIRFLNESTLFTAATPAFVGQTACNSSNPIYRSSDACNHITFQFTEQRGYMIVFHTWFQVSWHFDFARFNRSLQRIHVDSSLASALTRNRIIAAPGCDVLVVMKGTDVSKPNEICYWKEQGQLTDVCVDSTALSLGDAQWTSAGQLLVLQFMQLAADNSVLLLRVVEFFHVQVIFQALQCTNMIVPVTITSPIRSAVQITVNLREQLHIFPRVFAGIAPTPMTIFGAGLGDGRTVSSVTLMSGRGVLQPQKILSAPVLQSDVGFVVVQPEVCATCGVMGFYLWFHDAFLGGNLTSVNACAYENPPAVYSVTPNSGTVEGGTTITIVGDHFVVFDQGVYSLNVTICGLDATVLVRHEKALVVLTPPCLSSASQQDITVTMMYIVFGMYNGTLEGKGVTFTYLTQPGVFMRCAKN